MGRLDPRTKLALGLMAIGAVFIARKPETLFVECSILLVLYPLLGNGKTLIQCLRLAGPMVCLVFAIALFSFDIQVALLLSIRLFNLLGVSFIFFRMASTDEVGAALKKMGIPYGFVFILTTAMRYVPLMGEKLRSIVDAQRSRGIDLRPRLRNARNFMALLFPLLVQSFILSDELAMAMEARGFRRKGRSSRRQYRLRIYEYVVMAASLVLLLALAWWEKG